MLINKLKIFVLIFFLASFLFANVNNEENNNFKIAMLLSEKGNMLKSLDYLLKIVAKKEDGLAKPDNLKNTQNQTKYKKGLDAFNTGNYYDALSIFLNLFFRDPENNAVIYYLKKIYEKIGYIESDATYYDTKDIIKFYEQRISDSYDFKQYIRAYDYYEKLSILNTPKKKSIKIIDFINEELDAVIKRFEKYDIEKYHYAKAYFYFVNGDIENTISEWQKIVVINPDNLEVGEYLAKFKDVAIKDLFVSRKTTYFLKIGINLFNDLEYERAIVYFDDVLRVDKDNEIAIFYLNQSKIKIKEFDELFQIRQQESYKKNMEKMKVLKIQNKNELINKNKNIKKVLVEDEKKKLNDLKEKMNEEEVINKKINSLYAEGMLYYQQGDYLKAEKTWKEILKYDPTNVKVIQKIKELKRKN